MTTELYVLLACLAIVLVLVLVLLLGPAPAGQRGVECDDLCASLGEAHVCTSQYCRLENGSYDHICFPECTPASSLAACGDSLDVKLRVIDRGCPTGEYSPEACREGCAQLRDRVCESAYCATAEPFAKACDRTEPACGIAKAYTLALCSSEELQEAITTGCDPAGPATLACDAACMALTARQRWEDLGAWCQALPAYCSQAPTSAGYLCHPCSLEGGCGTLRDLLATDLACLSTPVEPTPRGGYTGYLSPFTVPGLFVLSKAGTELLIGGSLPHGYLAYDEATYILREYQGVWLHLVRRADGKALVAKDNAQLAFEAVDYRDPAQYFEMHPDWVLERTPGTTSIGHSGRFLRFRANARGQAVAYMGEEAMDLALRPHPRQPDRQTVAWAEDQAWQLVIKVVRDEEAEDVVTYWPLTFMQNPTDFGFLNQWVLVRDTATGRAMLGFGGNAGHSVRYDGTGFTSGRGLYLAVTDTTNPDFWFTAPGI